MKLCQPVILMAITVNCQTTCSRGVIVCAGWHCQRGPQSGATAVSAVPLRSNLAAMDHDQNRHEVPPLVCHALGHGGASPPQEPAKYAPPTWHSQPAKRPSSAPPSRSFSIHAPDGKDVPVRQFRVGLVARSGAQPDFKAVASRASACSHYRKTNGSDNQTQNPFCF
jgi:hypothetical protein